MTLVAAVAIVAATGLIGLAHQWALPRVRTERPPVGRFDAGDLAFVLLFTTGVPLLWLGPPATVGSAVFAVVLFSIARIGLEPILSGRLATLTALALCVGELGLWLAGARTAALAVNNALVAVAVISVSLFWIQLGMRAIHVVVFTVTLALFDVAGFVYDFMPRLGDAVASRPFSPQLAVAVADVRLFLGLGDLLLIVLWAGAVRKAYGRPAALGAQVAAVVMLAGFVAASRVGLVAEFPMVVVWGPVVTAQWLLLRLRFGRERTVAQWVAAERITPLRGRRLANPPLSSVTHARSELAADVRALIGSERYPHPR